MGNSHSSSSSSKGGGKSKGRGASVPDVRPDPIAGIKILPPKRTPEPGEVVVGYQLVEGPAECCDACTCCVVPEPSRMSQEGWMSVLLIALIFTPMACLPCCIAKNYEQGQVPIYGPPPPPPPPPTPRASVVA